MTAAVTTKGHRFVYRKEPVVREVSSRHLVSCPECGFQCPHAKIISHLKRCQKALQANNKVQLQQQQQQQQQAPQPLATSTPSAVSADHLHVAGAAVPHEPIKAQPPSPTPIKVRVKDLKKLVAVSEADQLTSVSLPVVEVKKYESDLVKKVFLKKFEAEKAWPGTPSPEPQVFFLYISNFF